MKYECESELMKYAKERESQICCSICANSVMEDLQSIYKQKERETVDIVPSAWRVDRNGVGKKETMGRER